MKFQDYLLNATNERNRLKPSFNLGEIPTPQDFHDLIDGLFLLQGDSLYKDADSGLHVQASTDPVKNVLLFYENATQEAAWTMSIQDGWHLKDGSGAARFSVATDGKVGIGTTTPEAPLSITSPAVGGNEDILKLEVSDAPSDYFRIMNMTAASGQFMPALYSYHDTDNREALLIIGAISNTANNDGTNPVMHFEARTENAPYTLSENSTRPLFAWGSYNAKKMVMMANGRLGLGTENPEADLHIQRSANVAGINVYNTQLTGFSAITAGQGNLGRYIYIGYMNESYSDSYNTGFAPKSGVLYTGGESGLRLISQRNISLFSGGTTVSHERLRILSNGNIGIGNNNPGYKLEINGSVKINNDNNTTGGQSGHLYFHSTHSDFARIYSEQGAANSIRLVLEAGDDGGDGDHVVIRNYHYSLGSHDVLVARRNNISVYGNIHYTGGLNPSDASFKKDIQSMPEEVITSLGDLKGKTYCYRTDEFKEKGFNEGAHMGFIAQELQEIYPHLVSEDPEGYLSINYTGLIPILVEAYKQQQAEIKKLTARLDN